MSAFDKIIGYDHIKKELLKTLDMFRNPELYEEMGAKRIHGILLSGDPGMGKTMMAQAFIKESGIRAYTLRRAQGSDDFIDQIRNTFIEARNSAPAIILLDDMDKFANEDDTHPNAPEYVAIQSSMDNAKDYNVLVIGTVNDEDNLPDSLYRPGRFDQVIKFNLPTQSDARKIVEHYLSQKKVSAEVNSEDVLGMTNYKSCAQLEGLVNNAAIACAFEHCPEIETRHLVSAFLGSSSASGADFSDSDPDKIDAKILATHEAGHLVAAEILCPGSVGFANIRPDASTGFIRLYNQLKNNAQRILTALASKAAVELYYPDPAAIGCDNDLKKAIALIRADMENNASLGFGAMNLKSGSFWISPPDNGSNAIVVAELERYFRKAKDLIVRNREFLEKVTDALSEKSYLLRSDIRRIRESVPVVYPT